MLKTIIKLMILTTRADYRHPWTTQNAYKTNEKCIELRFRDACRESRALAWMSYMVENHCKTNDFDDDGRLPTPEATRKDARRDLRAGNPACACMP